MIDKGRWEIALKQLDGAPHGRRVHAEAVMYDLAVAEIVRQCMGLSGENTTVLIAEMIQRERLK